MRAILFPRDVFRLQVRHHKTHALTHITLITGCEPLQNTELAHRHDHLYKCCFGRAAEKRCVKTETVQIVPWEINI